MKFRLAVDDRVTDVEVDGTTVRVNGEPAAAVIRKSQRGFVVVIRGRRVAIRPGVGGAFVNGIWRTISTSDILEESGTPAGRAGPRAALEVRPPMPGRVIAVLVAAGQTVRKEQPLLILEAMKMQNEVPAPIAGVVEAVRIRAGDSLTVQDVIAVIRGSQA